MGRVLIVEDDDRVARLLVRALEGDGYAVELAASGLEIGTRFASVLAEPQRAARADVGLRAEGRIHCFRAQRSLRRFWTEGRELQVASNRGKSHVYVLAAVSGRVHSALIPPGGVSKEQGTRLLDGNLVPLTLNCRWG